MEINSHWLVEVFSWTLIHFVWQALIVGALAYASHLLLRRSSPQVRYIVAISFMLILIAFPAITLAVLCGQHSTPMAPNLTLLESPKLPQLVSPSTVEFPTVEFESASHRYASEFFHFVVVTFWFAGHMAVSARLWFSAFYIYRLRITANAADQIIQSVAERLATGIGIACPTVLVSDRVECAFACGFFRETIIVPARWLTEMTGEMIESVLAHEFAHLRRYDLWVNLFQRIVESVFFFHPIVWWLSARIRSERELCCDILAVQQTQNKHNYAKTLEYVARARFSNERVLATQMGDDRMSLLRRVRCVLGESSSRANSSSWPISIIAVSTLAVLVWFSPFSDSLAEEVAQAVVDQPIPEEVDLASYEIPKPSFADAAHLPGGPTLADWKLGEYLIEPPDILKIRFIEPKLHSPRRITPSDVLQVSIPIDGKPSKKNVAVDDDGTISVAALDKFLVAGLSEIEAARRIKYALQASKNVGTISVQVVRPTPELAPEGKHLVAPDGTVNLGNCGRVYVAGMTVQKAKEAIRQRLSHYYEKLKLNVDVWAINSKYCYVVTEGPEESDQVIRLPVTGIESVLDAVSQLGGIGQVSQKNIWISRPDSTGESTVRILTIDWNAITRGSDTTTNYQLLPDDRLFISSKKPAGANSLGKKTSQGIYGLSKGLHPLSLADAPFDKFQELETHEQDLITSPATDPTRLPSKDQVEESVHRIPLMGALTSGGKASVLPPPNDEELLRIVEVAKPSSRLLKDRKNVMAVVQLIGDYVDPPSFFPLVGPAQMHHAHYKVTLGLKSGNRCETVEEFNVDHQHLHASEELKGLATADEVYFESYYVSDLVLPIAPPKFSATGEIKRVKNAEPDFETLIELVKSTIAPDSWQSLGGFGSLKGFKDNLSLVISNTGEVHDEIADLFAQLRALQTIQVEFRATKLTIPDDLVRSLGLAGKISGVLTHEQWRQILETQWPPKSRGREAMKMRIFNGQIFKFEADGNQEFMTQAVVSNDRRSVRLSSDAFTESIGERGKAGFFLKSSDGNYKLISVHPHLQTEAERKSLLGQN